MFSVRSKKSEASGAGSPKSMAPPTRGATSVSMTPTEESPRNLTTLLGEKGILGTETGDTARSTVPGTPGGEDAFKLVEKVPIIERTSVSLFFAGVVLSNAVFIGFDVDMRAKQNDGDGQVLIFVIIEITYVFCYTSELVLRVMCDKCPGWFKDAWNWLDLSLLVISVLDIVTSLILSGDSDVSALAALRLLKSVRMVRLFRLFRVLKKKEVIRMIRGLLILLKAILGALKALGWIGLMIVALIYICAIVTTEFLGINGGDDPLLDEWFGDVMKSMFTLFQMSTMQQWAEITRHVSKKMGAFWTFFFILYVMATNMVLLNVVLAVLIEKLFDLTTSVKEAHTGDNEDAESWMQTPSDMSEEEDEEGQKTSTEGDGSSTPGGSATNRGTTVAGEPEKLSDKMVMQMLSEFFDVACTFVGEGGNHRKMVTLQSLKETLHRTDVQQRLFQAVPTIMTDDVGSLAQRLFDLCPKRMDSEGMSKQELAEACLVSKNELSMNQFVMISMALQRLERNIDHELCHLNKHQRKMNRRFLKMRHRLRKVYHFDGAPRKMVDMVNQIKKKEREKTMKKEHGPGGSEEEAKKKAGSGEEDGWKEDGPDDDDDGSEEALDEESGSGEDESD